MHVKVLESKNEYKLSSEYLRDSLESDYQVILES